MRSGAFPASDGDLYAPSDAWGVPFFPAADGACCAPLLSLLFVPNFMSGVLDSALGGLSGGVTPLPVVGLAAEAIESCPPSPSETLSLVSFTGAFAGFALAFALIHGFSFIGVAFPVWMVSRVIDPILYEPLLPIPLPTSNSVSFGCEALSPFPPRGVEARAIFCSKFAVLVASEPREAPPCDASLSSSCTQMHSGARTRPKRK